MSTVVSTLADMPAVVNDVISDTFIGNTFLFGVKLTPAKIREFGKDPKGSITFEMLFGKVESNGPLDKVSVFGVKKSFSDNIAWQMLTLPYNRVPFITSVDKLNLITEKMNVLNRMNDGGNIDVVSSSSEDILSSFKALSYDGNSQSSCRINPSFNNDQRSLVFSCDVKNKTYSSNVSTIDPNHSRKTPNVNNFIVCQLRSSNKRKLDETGCCERDVTFDGYSQMFDTMNIPTGFITNSVSREESRSGSSPKVSCIQHVLNVSQDVDERTLITLQEDGDDFFVADSFLEDAATSNDNVKTTVDTSCDSNNSLSLNDHVHVFQTDLTKPMVNDAPTKHLTNTVVYDAVTIDCSSTKRNCNSTRAGGPEEQYFTGVDWTVNESYNLELVADQRYQFGTDIRTKCSVVDDGILGENLSLNNAGGSGEQREIMRCDKDIESSIVLNVSRVICDDSYVSQDLCAAGSSGDTLQRFVLNMPQVGFSPANIETHESLLYDLPSFSDTFASWEGHVGPSQGDILYSRATSNKVDDGQCSRGIVYQNLSSKVAISCENESSHQCTLVEYRPCSRDQVHFETMSLIEDQARSDEMPYAEDRAGVKELPYAEVLVNVEEMPYSEDLEAFIAGSMTEGSSTCFVNSGRLKSENVMIDEAASTDNRITNIEEMIITSGAAPGECNKVISHKDPCDIPIFNKSLIHGSLFSESVIFESSFNESLIPGSSLYTAMCTNTSILSSYSESILLSEKNMLQSKDKITTTQQQSDLLVLSDSVSNDSNIHHPDTLVARINNDECKLFCNSNRSEEQILGRILLSDVLSDSCELFSSTQSSLCSPRSNSSEMCCNSYSECPPCVSLSTDVVSRQKLSTVTSQKENIEPSVSFISTLSAMNFSQQNINDTRQQKNIIIPEPNDVSPQQRNVQFCKKLTTVMLMSDVDQFIPQTPSVQRPIKSCLRQTPRNCMSNGRRGVKLRDIESKGSSAPPLSCGFDLVASGRGTVNDKLLSTNRVPMSLTLNREMYSSGCLTDHVSNIQRDDVITEDKNLNKISTDIVHRSSSVCAGLNVCENSSNCKERVTEPCFSSNISCDLFQTKSNTSADCDLFTDDISSKRGNSLRSGGGDYSTRYSSPLICSTPLLDHRLLRRIPPSLLRVTNDPSPVSTNHKRVPMSCDRKPFFYSCDSPAVILNMRKCAKVEMSKATLRVEEISDGLESLHDSSLFNSSENISLSQSVDGVVVSQSQYNDSRTDACVSPCSVDLFDGSAVDQYQQDLSRICSSSFDLFE